MTDTEQGCEGGDCAASAADAGADHQVAASVAEERSLSSQAFGATHDLGYPTTCWSEDPRPWLYKVSRRIASGTPPHNGVPDAIFFI